MIKTQFTGSARRARNIIWNAAGRYDFEPGFMAFFPDGSPDHYFDMMIGFAEKWLDMEKITGFFQEYAYDRRADEFDELLWIGLENCLYQKEVAERPILHSLRTERAGKFLAGRGMLSKQQMEYQSMPVYTQQEARWAEVAGEKLPLMTPREKRMYEALRFEGTLDTEDVIRRMKNFLRTFFRFEKPAAAPVKHRANPLLKLLLRREHKRRDHFLVRTGTGEGDHLRAVSLGHAGLGTPEPPSEEDEKFIRSVFGTGILSASEMRFLTNILCTEEDAGCRLWVTKGDHTDPTDKEAAAVQAAKKKQRTLNEAFLNDHSYEARHAVRKLNNRIEAVLESYRKHLPENAWRGRMDAGKVYRLPVLSDGKVFLKDGDETEQEYFVDILLDASQSRMNLQEVLSAEAYIVAKSFTELRIPVRVCAFRSIRGFTVVDILKEARDTDCRGILGYYAGGWNRDALALKLLAHLENDPAMSGKQRILLIMTDANPNDSAPAASERLLPQEYEGAIAVEACRKAVNGIRTGGIKTGAVFHGNSSHLDDLHRIYGHQCVRVRGASQLAEGISDLLLMMLREMRTD